MSIHAARRIALQKIFARFFHDDDCSSVLEGLDDHENAQEDSQFIDSALKGTHENEQAYNAVIQSLSPSRSLERIPYLDRAILLLALHELSQDGALPKVIINEAVELAKRYGDESDSRFINGVLGSFVRQRS
ncbi:MAG: transcription antitermination factor NusB [Bacillota bacterium]|nr:transcription antitermination factor NusB [Bacillota bacterium]